MGGKGPAGEALSAFLGMLTELLQHPSGLVATRQLNTWIVLLREKTIVDSGLLAPFVPQVLSSFMGKLNRLLWPEVESASHPLTAVLEATWNDKLEYDTWLNDTKSKTSQLFRLISRTHPLVAASALEASVSNLIREHGNEQPRDYLDPSNRLTQSSTANVAFECVVQPLENILNGLPERTKQCIEGDVGTCLFRTANAIIRWSPNDPWLRFRRAQMLESLKFYWAHDTRTLQAGVDALFFYLSADDEPSRAKLSQETANLRKRSGFALLSVAKHLPKLLVPHLGQLCQRAQSLFSSSVLFPLTRMSLYEFLTCVANAVEDPPARRDFIRDVLSNTLEDLESPEMKEAMGSMEGLISAMGIAAASSNPESITNPSNVKLVCAKYDRIFHSINYLLAIGKRCNSAAKGRPSGGLPLQNLPFDAATCNFPDEGTVCIADLAVDDPFVPIWPRVFPAILQLLDSTLRIWHPECQAALLQHPVQRYACAISDDEAYLAKKQQSGDGGVFGEGGAAGSVVSGWNRRDVNLAPKWSGWLNELKYTCFQLLGLCARQRALFSLEIAPYLPKLVAVIYDPLNLHAMEHRHLIQLINSSNPSSSAAPPPSTPRTSARSLRPCSNTFNTASNTPGRPSWTRQTPLPNRSPPPTANPPRSSLQRGESAGSSRTTREEVFSSVTWMASRRNSSSRRSAQRSPVPSATSCRSPSPTSTRPLAPATQTARPALPTN